MSSRDQIEFEEPTYSVCGCCGDTTTHLVRFVSRDGSAFAVYYADFSKGHDYVSVLASFGDWGEDAPQESRVAFNLRVWVEDDAYQVGIGEPGDALYPPLSIMGRILAREEALAHPFKQEAFDLSDHIVECDQPVIRFLEGGDCNGAIP